MHKKIFLFLLVTLTLISSVSASINWVDNSNQLTKGLADMTITSPCKCWVDPTIFYKDGVWTAIASGGDNPSEYFGFTWDGTQWVSNPSVIAGLPSIDHYISPSVFQINGVWVLVRGRWGDTGIPEGYVWNGASWVVDSKYSSGLSPLSEGKPTIFKMTTGEYVLIMEHAYTGTYTGYTWTGSSWLNNPSLVSGLEGLGTYTHPAAFVKDNENILIISRSDSDFVGRGPGVKFSFLGFKWNGNRWISDSSQVTGLGDIHIKSAIHTVFEKDGKWVLIGTSDWSTNYFGFESPVATPTEPTPSRTITRTPTPTPTPVVTTPTPCSTSTSSVNLHGEKTDVIIGENVLLKLSAINIIGNPIMHVQVIIIPPNGWSVTSSEFSKSGVGQYVTMYDLKPVDGSRDIEVNIMPNQIGDNFEVKGRIIYYFGDDLKTKEDCTLKLPIKVRGIPTQPAGIPTISFWVSILIFGILYIFIKRKR